MMGSITFGHLQTVWSMLHRAALRGPIPGDNQIIIVSPWHHNAPRNEDGWSPEILDSIYGVSSRGSESLSDILSKLVSMGFEVKVVTLSQHGRALARDDNHVLDREKDFFEILDRNEIYCCLVDNIHHKYLRTPFELIEGSMNLSKNGLFGMTRDTMTLISKSHNQQIFEQNSRIIEDLLNSSRSYFVRPDSVSRLKSLRFKLMEMILRLTLKNCQS